MKSFRILIIILFSATLSIYAQDPNILWQKGYYGDFEYQFLNKSFQTSDLGYIMGGYIAITCPGFYQEVTKIDALGEIIWEKRNIYGIFGDLQQTSDNGYILVGYSNPVDPNSGYDFLIYKISENVVIQWNKRFGGNFADKLYAVQQTNDGGYILGGPSDSNISGDKTEDSRGETDYWIIKLDSAGNIQWQKTIGGSGYDDLKRIIQTADNGYIVAGTSESPISGEKTEPSRGGDDYWIIKLDSTGNIQWQKTIGGNSDDDLTDMKITSDGGYIVSGTSTSNISGEKSENNYGLKDYWVLKLNSTGEIEWQKTLGGSVDDTSKSIIQTSDNGYLVGGTSNSNISGIKLENSQGMSDYWIIKLDVNGNIIGQNNLGTIYYDDLTSISENLDGSLLLGGSANYYTSGDKTVEGKYWIINHGSILGAQDYTTTNELTVYPNPVQSVLTIETSGNPIEKIKIYDINGWLISEFKNIENPKAIDLSCLESGIYLAEFSNRDDITIKKIIKE